MYDSESREAILGHSAEEAITRWLTGRGVHVVPTHAFTHNTADTAAPMMRGPADRLFVLPDLLCFPPRERPYWLEVKARQHPGWHQAEGRWEHGIDLNRVLDYSQVAQISGIPVRIALLEVHSPIDEEQGGTPARDHCRPSGLWLMADLDDILATGTSKNNWPRQGEQGWLWPRQVMMAEHSDASLAAVPDDISLPTCNEPDWPDWLPDIPRHSVLSTDPDLPLGDIEILLRRGIKVHWFVREAPELEELAIFAAFKVGLLNLHPLTEDAPGLLILDGDCTAEERDRLWQLDRTEPAEGLRSFNAGQYLVEHAPPEQNLQVRAGAGTGKTQVMIQRVLFLLGVVDDLEPAQIALITFTREATRVMKSRLVAAISIRFRLTGQERFLQWLLALPGMQISTIPAFGRHLLTRAGSALGISPDFQIRQFTLERRQAIRDVLNTLLSGQLAESRVETLLGRRLFEFEKTAERFWQQLENKGLDRERIERLDWGQGGDPDSERINRIWSSLFSESERALEALKAHENAVSISDLTRLLRGLRDGLEELSQQRETWKYLFVDEFQDTDEVQIDLVDTLSDVLAATVFVVGDVKHLPLSGSRLHRVRAAGASLPGAEQQPRRIPAPEELPHQPRHHGEAGALLSGLGP